MQDAGNPTNVYAELGSTWRYVMRDPDQAAHLLGKLLKTFGEDRVLWGTDSIWYGSPQDQIQAFRAFQIGREFQQRHGYPELTPQLKRKVFGLNAAQVYGLKPDAQRRKLAKDRVQKSKLDYLNDPQPTFATYGPRTGASGWRCGAGRETCPEVLRGVARRSTALHSDAQYAFLSRMRVMRNDRLCATVAWEHIARHDALRPAFLPHPAVGRKRGDRLPIGRRTVSHPADPAERSRARASLLRRPLGAQPLSAAALRASPDARASSSAGPMSIRVAISR